MALPHYYMDADSTEYRRVLVAATDDAGLDIDPTVYAVDIAFTEHGARPVAADWNSATWVTLDGDYYARVLVGPDGGITLTETDYSVYVRINAGTEFPVLLCGFLSMR